MKELWKWHGMVAVILSSGVAASIILISIGGFHVNTDEATLLSTTTGAIIGALATYLGGDKSNGRNGTNGGNGTNSGTDHGT